MNGLFEFIKSVTILNSSIVWFIPVVIVFVLVQYYVWHKRSQKVMGNAWYKMWFEGVSVWKPKEMIWKAILASVVMVILIIVLAEPVVQQSRNIYGGVRITFLVDASTSMGYAQDVPPYLHRQQAANALIESMAHTIKFDHELRGSYEMSLIAFKGQATVLMPFTNDHLEFTNSIYYVNGDVMSAGGTSILAAFEQFAAQVTIDPPDVDTLELVILISDGDVRSGLESELYEIQALVEQYTGTLLIKTVGIGSVDAITRKPIRVPLWRTDSDGSRHRVLEDPDNPSSPEAYSELDESLLIHLASYKNASGGYTHYSNASPLIEELKQIILENRISVGALPSARSESMADWFLMTALLILLFFFDFHRKILKRI